MKRSRLASTVAVLLAATAMPAPSAPAEVRPLPGAADDLEIVPTPGGAIVGRLVDREGEPVPGGRVRLLLLPASERRGPVFIDDQFAFAAESVAGEDGRFSHRHLATGRYELRADHPHHATRVLPPIEVLEDETIDLGTIELAPGGQLAGRVLDADRRPVEGVTLQADVASAARFDSAPVGELGQSDAEGRFELNGLPTEEPLRLTAQHAGYSKAELVGITLPLDRPLVVELHKGSRIFGRVLGPDGEPIGNANVHAATSVAYPMSSGSASTAADGSFEIAGLRGGTVGLGVRADGYPDRQVEGLALGDDDELGPLEIRLAAGGEISGRVLAPDGSPVPGAEVWAVTRRTPAEPGNDRSSFLLDREEIGRWSPGDRWSDARGEFVIRGAAVGPTVVRAEHDRLGDAEAGLEVRPGTNTIELILDRRGRLEGRVVAGDGEPVPGARVELTAADEKSRNWSEATDFEGRFIFRSLDTGKYQLGASAPGLILQGPPVAVTLAGTPAPVVDLVLTPGEEIAGRILGVPEAELLQLQVGATLSAGSSFSHVSASPGPDGRFRLTGLGPGLWSVVASAPSGRSARGEVEVRAGGGPYRLELDLGGGLTLTGSVRVGGEPLAQASIQLLGLDVAHSATVNTAFDGSFRAAGLEPGRYAILVSAALSKVGRDELVLTADDEIHLNLPVASLSGRVLDAGGEPASGAQVMVTIPGSLGSGGLAFADDAGRFAVGRLAPGRYAVSARRQGPIALTTVSLEAGDDRELELRLEKGFELVVAPVSSSGGWLDRLRLTVFRPGEMPVYIAETPLTADRTAVFSEVPAGEWTIAVSGDRTAIVGATASVPGPPIALTLPPPTVLEVEVPALAEVALVPFAVAGPDGREPAAAALDACWLYRGRAAIGDLPPGTWTVSVVAPDGREFQGTATTAPDRPATLVLD